MSEERRAAQRNGGFAQVGNLLPVVETLKKRESWKYTALREALQKSGRVFEFEFELNGRIFDLALLDTMTLVEFDGPYHEWEEQRRDDAAKDTLARNAGFTVVRREVPSTVVIDPEVLGDL